MYTHTHIHNKPTNGDIHTNMYVRACVHVMMKTLEDFLCNKNIFVGMQMIRRRVAACLHT